MADTINTPAGPFPKKGVLIVLVLTGGIVAYAYYRHRSAGAAPAATDTTGAATTGYGFDPNAIDPNTGLTLAQEGGSQGGAYQYGYNPYSPPQPAPQPVATQQFVSNGDWAQAAEDYLVNTVGADATTVAAALGKYITGQQLTVEQQGVVSSAVAFFNYPPVPGVGGKPPGMNVAAQGGPPPPPGPPQLAHNPVSGLRLTDRGFTSLTVDWQNSPHATGYLVTALQGSHVIVSEHVTASTARVGNLHRGARYDIRVRAQPGGKGGHDANLMATTKK